MTKTAELNEHLWNEWVATRPDIVQDLCRRFPPDRLYRLKNTGQRVMIYSYGENGTMTVTVTSEWNPSVVLDRRVFGIPPEDLEESEPTGTQNDKSP